MWDYFEHHRTCGIAWLLPAQPKHTHSSPDEQPLSPDCSEAHPRRSISCRERKYHGALLTLIWRPLQPQLLPAPKASLILPSHNPHPCSSLRCFPACYYLCSSCSLWCHHINDPEPAGFVIPQSAPYKFCSATYESAV